MVECPKGLAQSLSRLSRQLLGDQAALGNNFRITPQWLSILRGTDGNTLGDHTGVIRLSGRFGKTRSTCCP
jgi:hypothetical protein